MTNRCKNGGVADGLLWREFEDFSFSSFETHPEDVTSCEFYEPFFSVTAWTRGGNRAHSVCEIEFWTSGCL